jgi:putative membrane protein
MEVSDMVATWGHAGGLWFLFPLIWLTVIVGLVFLFRRWSWRGYDRRSSGADVLAERYARGEITEDEYRQRLRVLRER